jgi:hypothetical protein
MKLNTIISRTGALIESGLDDELFALDIDGGNCYGFNATATEIWRLLETPIMFEDLCAALMHTRDVDQATCFADTAAMIEMLADENLVALTPQ